HGKRVTDIAFSPDGRSLVTSSGARTARIWSVQDGTEQAVLSGHAGGLNSAAFSPNGADVTTTSSQDRTVRLWDARSGRQISILAGQEGNATDKPARTFAAFNFDGTRVAILSGDTSVRIIRVFRNPQELIDYAHSVVPRELSQCERKRFFLPVQGAV